jgi:hypothetical protein
MSGTRGHRLLVAGAIVGALALGAQAALAAPPSKVALGTAKTVASGGSLTNLGNTHTTVITLSVPAGKYHVTARLNATNQTSVAIPYVACNVLAGGAFIDSGSVGVLANDGAAVSFPVNGVIDMASAGAITVECIQGGTGTEASLVGGRVVATTVAAIIGS